MSRYQMSDGTVVDTTRAVKSWMERTNWDGHNHVSRATGSQWDHQQLYRTRRGRYYIESWSQWQGSTPGAEWISNEEACRWLLTVLELSDDELPDDLTPLAAGLLQ